MKAVVMGVVEHISNPALLALLGALISALGALWIALGKVREEHRQYDERRQRCKAWVIFFGVTLLAASGYWASSEQIQFERELRAKSEEIAELNRETVRMIIGGESFCFLTIASLSSKTNRGILIAEHKGQYPLYDVVARVVDLEKFDQLRGNITPKSTRYTDKILLIGNMIPGHASQLGLWNLGDRDRVRYNVFFTARNGSFHQLLQYRKVDGVWAWATRVFRGEEVIHEVIDKRFPLNEEGGVEW